MKFFSDLKKYISNKKLEAKNIKLVSKNPEYLRELPEEQQTNNVIWAAVKVSRPSISYAKNPSEKICLKFLNKYPRLLMLIKNQTERMCLLVVSREKHMLKFVEKQTPEICFQAVKFHSKELKVVDDPSEELCWMALKDDSSNLQYIYEQTPEMIQYAIKDNIENYEFIKGLTITHFLEDNYSYHQIKEAIKKKPLLIQFCKDQTEELCYLAVRQNAYCLKFCKIKNLRVCKKAIRNHSSSIKFVPYELQDIDMKWDSIRGNCENLAYIQNPSYKMIEYCLKEDAFLLTSHPELFTAFPPNSSAEEILKIIENKRLLKDKLRKL